jgi:tetratricopeptide (TPR) repeat protein
MSRVLAAAAGLLLACACATSQPASRPPPGGASRRAAEAVARARALRAAGNLAGAEGWLEAALAHDPTDAAARLELADLLVAGGGDTRRAAALLVGLPGTDPTRDQVLGRLAELRDDLPAAEAAYARALAAQDDPEVRLRRALLLERLGRGAELVPELEKVRAARPDDVVARARLAERYEQAGRLADAEVELRWLAEASGRPEAWRRLAAFLTRTRQPDKAKAAEGRAREADRGSKRSLRPLLPSSR